jgi:hypothetical protein
MQRKQCFERSLDKQCIIVPARQMRGFMQTKLIQIIVL